MAPLPPSRSMRCVTEWPLVALVAAGLGLSVLGWLLILAVL